MTFETHETCRALLDELEKFSPPLFLDLSSYWISNILDRVEVAHGELKKAHADLVEVCTNLIDSNKEIESVWKGSQLHKAMQFRAQKRDEYMRVIRLVIREDSKRPMDRLSTLIETYESLYEFYNRVSPDDRTYSTGLTMVLRLEGLEEEMKQLRRWRKQVSRLHAHLNSLEQDACTEPDVTKFKELEREKEKKSDEVRTWTSGDRAPYTTILTDNRPLFPPFSFRDSLRSFTFCRTQIGRRRPAPLKRPDALYKTPRSNFRLNVLASPHLPRRTFHTSLSYSNRFESAVKTLTTRTRSS